MKKPNNNNSDVTFENLLLAIEYITKGPEERDAKLVQVCGLLAKSVSGYDWVGFYLVDPQKSNELILGPFVGEPTDHVRIKFGQGICGQAAEKEAAIIIDDVSCESNYLSCSVNVKSEIVLPMFKDGRLIGELDLDSNQPARFKRSDSDFLSKVCALVSRIF
jgi:L-methionine (R)-S-oxide reductase